MFLMMFCTYVRCLPLCIHLFTLSGISPQHHSKPCTMFPLSLMWCVTFVYVYLHLSPVRPFHAACGFVCVKILITTHSPAPPHTHARSIGVQSGKGLSVVLCEWPLLKQINRHWHVPPPTKRKQLKAIDPVPGSSMNMHVSLTFPWRGEERETDRLTDRCRSTPLPISCNVNWFVTVLCVAMDCSFLCESAHIKSPTCLPSVHEANRRIKACETSCSFISPF